MPERQPLTSLLHISDVAYMTLPSSLTHSLNNHQESKKRQQRTHRQVIDHCESLPSLKIPLRMGLQDRRIRVLVVVRSAYVDGDSLQRVARTI